MKLIVGLGNPDRQYANTRHNVGFMAIDRLVVRNRLIDQGDAIKTKFHAHALQARLAGNPCMLLQPQTYMNRSGLTVGQAVNFYDIDPSTDLLIVVDDLALPIGKLRFRAQGQPGGHNGLADIQRVLATQAYPRLRIGIDPPGNTPHADYVLSRFSPQQQASLEPALETACDAIQCWIKSGTQTAMNQFNAKDSQAHEAG